MFSSNTEFGDTEPGSDNYADEYLCTGGDNCSCDRAYERISWDENIVGKNPIIGIIAYICRDKDSYLGLLPTSIINLIPLRDDIDVCTCSPLREGSDISKVARFGPCPGCTPRKAEGESAP